MAEVLHALLTLTAAPVPVLVLNHVEVAQVARVALPAHLELHVAVQLRDRVAWHARLEVQAVHVLGDEVAHPARRDEPRDRTVRERRRRGDHVHALGRRAALRLARPDAVRAAVVRDARCCGNPRAREDHGALRVEEHRREAVHVRREQLGRVYQLLDLAQVNRVRHRGRGGGQRERSVSERAAARQGAWLVRFFLVRRTVESLETDIKEVT